MVSKQWNRKQIKHELEELMDHHFSPIRFFSTKTVPLPLGLFKLSMPAVLEIQIRKFLDLLDPDPLFRGTVRIRIIIKQK
jgi:hypothetical protein